MRRWTAAACVVANMPIAVSLAIWGSWEQPDERGGRGEHRPAQCGLLRQIPTATRAAGGEYPSTCWTTFCRRAQFSCCRDRRAGLLPRTRAERFLAGGGRHTPGEFWQVLADTLRSRHPELRAGATPRATIRRERRPKRPVRAFRQLCDVFNTAVGLDSAGRTQLHPQRPAGDRRREPDVGFRGMLKSLVIESRRHARADRQGTARHGLRTRWNQNRPRDLLRRALRRLLRRFRAPRRAVHGHHLERRLVARHAGLQASVHHLAPEGHQTPPPSPARPTRAAQVISARGDVGETLGGAGRSAA